MSDGGRLFDLRTFDRASCGADERKSCLPLLGQVLGIAARFYMKGRLNAESAPIDVKHPFLAFGLRLMKEVNLTTVRDVLVNRVLFSGKKGAELLEMMIITEGILGIMDRKSMMEMRCLLLSYIGEDEIVSERNGHILEKAGEMEGRDASRMTRPSCSGLATYSFNDLPGLLAGDPARLAVYLSCLDYGMTSKLFWIFNDSALATLVPLIARLERREEHLAWIKGWAGRELNDYERGYYMESDPLETAARIIQALHHSVSARVLEILKGQSPEIYEQVSGYVTPFESVVALDDRSIQKVLRTVDTSDMAKALKGAPGEVAEKIFRNMSKRAAQMLKEDMEYMGPISRQDALYSQKKISEVIQKLIAQGEIVISNDGEDLIIV